MFVFILSFSDSDSSTNSCIHSPVTRRDPQTPAVVESFVPVDRFRLRSAVGIDAGLLFRQGQGHIMVLH
jgi:hypothetical protein